MVRLRCCTSLAVGIVSNGFACFPGICQDHIYVKHSTINQAGQGAFSRRFLLEGSIIISSPMLLATRNFLNLNITSKGEINPKQLMVNYHFGHDNSSILFLPINQMNAINHNSKRKWSGQEPNARVEFSTRDKKSRYYLSRPMQDVMKVRQYKMSGLENGRRSQLSLGFTVLPQSKYSTMVLDVIATRDIKPDEEIFIDYGTPQVMSGEFWFWF
jgi:hypothetical protein